MSLIDKRLAPETNGGPDGETIVESTVESIQRLILERICFLDYQPGDQLKEAVIAKEFGVSRTPVRDAISRISHLGLIETRNGVGTVVVALSDAEIRHVYEMRLELAMLIGTLSPGQVTNDHKVAAHALLNEVQGWGMNVDPRTYVKLNDRLNKLIADLIGNVVLRSFWLQTYYQAASTWHRVSTIVGSEVAKSLLDELSDLCTALEEDDMVAVGFVQRVHIGYGYQRIKTHLLAEQPE